MKTFIAMALLCTTASAQSVSNKMEAGVLLSGTFLKEIGTRDVGVGTSAVGFGGRFVHKALPYTDFETDILIWPNNQATAGTWIQGLFGVKIGKRFDRAGFFVKVRPGFMHFRKDPFGASKPGPGPGPLMTGNWASSTEASADLGGVIEYYTSRGVILRFDLGDTVLRYGRRSVVLTQLQPPIERGGFTTHNWQGSFGLSFPF
jgi:hypothetical protein